MGMNPYESPTHCEAGEASLLPQSLIWAAVLSLLFLEVVFGLASIALIRPAFGLSVCLLFASIGSAVIALALLRWIP